MNARLVITRDYEEKPQFWLDKNKANSFAFSVMRSADSPGAPGEDLQSKANLIGAQNGTNSFAGERYENIPRPGRRENKANLSHREQSQKKAISPVDIYSETGLLRLDSNRGNCSGNYTSVIR